VLQVASDAPARGYILVVPALPVHAVDAVELQSSTFNFLPDGTYHAQIFKLEETAAGRGKDYRRQSRMPNNQHLHVASQPRRPPFVIFAIHVDLGKWLSLATFTEPRTLTNNGCLLRSLIS